MTSDDLRMLGAAALAAAVVLVLLGVLLLGLSLKGLGANGWKLRVKLIGLGGVSGTLSFGTATYAGALLLLALSLASGARPAGGRDRAPVIGLVVATAAGWLALFNVVAVVVDLTASTGLVRVLGVVLVDMAAVVVAVVAGLWGLVLGARGRS